MRDVKGRRGSRGGGGSKGNGETAAAKHLVRRNVWQSVFSFASLISFISLTSLLPLSGCSRTVTTQPGVVNFVIETSPTNLDPRIGTDAVSERMDGLIFSSLVELDADRTPRGDLAEKWETPDPTTYVFHLRSGVKFHNGKALTSADVKYTFESILNGTVTSPKRGSYTLIKSIETPDPDSVIFRLKEPYAGFLLDISRPAIGIVPSGSGADFGSQLIGTGPFRFVSAKQDDNVILERNDGYFKTPPRISRVEFRIVPEAVVRGLELRKGTADLEENSLTTDMVSVLRSQQTIEIADRPGSTYAYLAFNFDDPDLASRDVRRALAYATDREQFVRYLLGGQAQLADGPLPANSWAFMPGLTHYDYDPAQAERLLDAAGFPRQAAEGGLRLKLTLKTTTEESSRLLGAVLREQWRKVGIDLELRPLEFATFYADVTRGSFDLYTLRWIGVNSDPEFFDFVFNSKKMPPAGGNRGHYRDPALDALLDTARVESDRDKRRELFQQIQKIVADDLPYMSLWFMDNISVHRKRITNLQLSPTGDYDFLCTIDAE
jgi:peptide/nickel transport system substrate-binding protein